MSNAEKQPARPIPFECRRCSKCCHGDGGIYYESHEIGAAAELLGVSAGDFISLYCQAKGQRYEVLTDADGDCRLLGPEGCMVHEAKPEICGRWPFFTNILERESAFEEAKLVCPGLNPEATIEEFRALHKSQTNEE